MIKPYYEEENITIYNGDCLEVIPELEQVDCIITDPPYNINYQSNMRVRSKKFNYIENDNNDFRFSVYSILYDKLKDNSVCAVFCSFKNYAMDYMELSKYFDIKNVVIWHKPGGGIGDLKHSLLTDYEMIIIAHKGNCEIQGKRIGSVWKTAKVSPNKMVHPTEKPASLINKLLDEFSKSDSTILDPFLGSGTTARACKDLGRKCIGIEISKEYCDIAVKRLGQEVLNLND